ncbi:MAG: ABC transporter ATP-binding protein [Hydrogenophaga sp.]|uniref:ABC transporter ATP-binding protein n=1 Tax=Hydrogenophaga sp. TaxID=1904254 RepID=UPI001D7C6746|nr:ABC transporter ATP-binding protein [Hydrogenophaga sp.]MBX3611347.1 ABC transporter ATP-binding protein [Hydrogenophaga sp.]
MSALLEATDLQVGYGSRVVAAVPSVQLHAGEVVALLGPNGGGKTTLLKTLLGLLPPLAGEVRLDDRALRDWSLPARAQWLGYVPQGQASTFGYSALQMVLMGRTAHLGLLARPGARDEAIAHEALERLGVAHLADRSVHRMSGGERQLVLIARALAQQPRAVLLDEPTASLDFGNQGRVLHAVRALADQGLGVLFTTHDPNQALRHADRALLLGDGRLLAQGPVSEVVTSAGLAALYGVPVPSVVEANGRAVFLPPLGAAAPAVSAAPPRP